MSHPGPSLLLLVRHGATTWAAQGRHTGRTDIELTDAGRAQSAQLTRLLERLLRDRGEPIVFTSDLMRAKETAALAMPGFPTEETHLLSEVDYGDFEGITAQQIEARQPGWSLFTDGCPGGESVTSITARCDSFIAKIERMASGRPVVAFTHGHLSRALAARLLDVPVQAASGLYNETATVGVFDHRRGALVLTGWNLTPK